MWLREELPCLFQCSIWGRTRPRKVALEGRVMGGRGRGGGVDAGRYESRLQAPQLRGRSLVGVPWGCREVTVQTGPILFLTRTETKFKPWKHHSQATCEPLSAAPGRKDGTWPEPYQTGRVCCPGRSHAGTLKIPHRGPDPGDTPEPPVSLTVNLITEAFFLFSKASAIVGFYAGQAWSPCWVT